MATQKKQKYTALKVITHRGHNKYYGEPLGPGQKERFKGGHVNRGAEFDLDHLNEAEIAKLVNMGAVALVGQPVLAKEK